MNGRHTLALAGALLLSTSCDGSLDEEPRVVGAGSLVIELPAGMGDLDRPAVVFPHDRHTRVLEKEPCKTCHPRDDEGHLSPHFARLEELTDRDERIALYHRECMTCHSERAARGKSSGPVTCGGCHVRSGPLQLARRQPTFDYALHARHVIAQGEECGDCHHVYDERADELVYREDAEESCHVCHGARAKGDRPSLERAVHTQCIGCHEEREDRGENAGPTTCDGCHGGKVPGGLPRPRTVARLMRGQHDFEQIAADDAVMGAVRFDHRVHERSTESCGDCHHQSLSPCEDCHTLDGDRKGGHVTLEAAFHRSGSRWSCVGCHEQLARDTQSCAGCHDRAMEVPGERTCMTCHERDADDRSVPDEPVFLEAVPEPSDDFPREIEIESLADEYEPAVFPHAAIVRELDRLVREEPLAVVFHGTTDVLCAGCHHHSPAGERPPPCGSCHADAGDPTEDKPSLLAAYHRQCLNCHRQMDLPDRGCTDCHERAPEVSR